MELHSQQKPNKIWVDKGSEFYNNSFKKWLKDNDIEMYLIHNEGKSVVAEKFIRTLKNKICKYMASISKNMYNDKLDDIVDEYKNTYHRTIKMKPIDIKDNIYISIQWNCILKKNLIIDILNLKLVIMLEFLNTKIFLLKDTHQIGLKRFLLLVKLKIQFHGHMLLMTSMVKKLLKHFMKKNYRRLIKNN